MILKLEETLRDKLKAFYDSRYTGEYHRAPEFIYGDIEDIADWLLKKWSKETNQDRTPEGDDH